jgi:hypothetical protein
VAEQGDEHDQLQCFGKDFRLSIRLISDDSYIARYTFIWSKRPDYRTIFFRIKQKKYVGNTIGSVSKLFLCGHSIGFR